MSRRADAVDHRTVAYLSIKGLSASIIARLLRCGERAVHTARALAIRERHLIKTEIFTDGQNPIPQDLSAKLNREFLLPHPFEASLQKIAKLWKVTPIRRITVVDTLSSDGKGLDTTSWITYRKVFGWSAAPFIRDLLLYGKTPKYVASAWGETLAAVLDGLNDILDTRSRESVNIQFFPLCGSSIDARSPLTTSSTHAARLASMFNKPGSQTPPSLAGVPALIPNSFKKEHERDVIRMLAQRSTSYKAIFGPGKGQRSPLINSEQCILTTIGSREEGYGDVTEEYFESWDEGPSFRSSVIGDIAGVFLPDPKLSDNDKRFIEQKNDQDWLGIRKRHFKECAERAHKEGHPGVVVVAIGKPTSCGSSGKARVILECLRYGLVNELVIDRQLFVDVQGLIETINNSPK